jgi:putative heme-binding domain-containing protein
MHYLLLKKLLPIAVLLYALAAGRLIWSGAQSVHASQPLTEARVPWTSSRVVGSPEPPPPFKVVRAFPNVKFVKPLLMARAPGCDRLFVGEQDGVLYSFIDRPDAKADLFFDLREELKTLHLNPDAKNVESVYGLAFHPDFERNRWCFVCYTLRGKRDEQNLQDGTRVSRFSVKDTDPPRIDPETEEIVVTFLQGGHNGGDLHFGPDRMLYISTGDATSPNPPDSFNTGQDVSDLLSSILRIDVDHKDAGKNYAVPRDNPFVGVLNARPEIWAYGFRNPWRMSFDSQDGELFVGDVGWELWEMIHRVERGGNYGWSAMEGPQPIKPEKIGPTPILPPLIALPHTISASITGGFVYHGKRFSELGGAYIFGDWETRRLWAARFEGNRTVEMPEIARPSVRIVAFGEDKNGEIYFLDHEGGAVHTIERNDADTTSSQFPRKLSQTGLFSSVSEQIPAPGVLPFAINSRQWQDGATARHWVAFPGDSAAKLYEKPQPIPGMVYWHNFRMHFPNGAVLVRTISLESRPIETQLLYYDGVDWNAYTYAWRVDQSDADLVPPDGAEKEFRGGDRQLMWQFQSRAQCMSCHSAWSEYALAFEPEQLNRSGFSGRNQLITFSECGLIQRVGEDGSRLAPYDASSVEKERKLADPADVTRPLESRVRSYLHANCGHCHTNGGGGTVDLCLQFPIKVDQMKAVGIRPVRGDFALPEACIVRPGDPSASTLYFRMAKFGRDRMPHIGSEIPDEAALQLIEDWITGLNGAPVKANRVADGVQPSELLADPRAALQIARQLGRNEIKPADRDRVLAAAAKLPASPVRDLFEGYLATGDRGERKLGSNPRPSTILAVQGKSTRGEQLFWSQLLHCGSCHKIGDRGTSLGPDLSTIGKVRSREDLLESLLEPSRRIEPKYSSYVAGTSDGRVITGLLVRRSENELVLRDAENKEFTLPATLIEQFRPSLTSMMPDGQLSALTAQQAADLLEYLASQK